MVAKRIDKIRRNVGADGAAESPSSSPMGWSIAAADHQATIRPDAVPDQAVPSRPRFDSVGSAWIAPQVQRVVQTDDVSTTTVSAKLAAAAGGVIATGDLFAPASSAATLSFDDAATLAVAAIKQGDIGKLDNQLSALYLAQSSSGAALSSYTNSVQQFASSFSSDGRYVLVDATAKDGNGAALLAQMQLLGATDGSSFGAVASGFIPVSRLGDLAGTANLRAARQSAMIRNVGVVTTQADKAQGSDLARATYGVSGAGVRVGVISDSFDSIGFGGGAQSAARDVATGDLPTGVRVLSEAYLNVSDEGRAMAQIVHDVAPGAGIDFATAYYGQASFANNILRLAAAGDKVIVDDISYFGELYYQNGIIGQAVNIVAAQGVTFLTSAGNSGTNGYESSWKSSGTATLLGQSYELMDFGNGQNYIEITNPANSTIEVQWDSPGASAGGIGSSNDVDFFITDQNGNVLSASTTNNVDGDPVELIAAPRVATGTYRLVVGLRTGAAPGSIKLIMTGGAGSFQSLASNSNNGTLTGHHGAEGAIAVGAAAYNKTPAYGVDPATAESFTSRGTQTLLFDDEGNRRPMPHVAGVAITAPDGGNTSFFSSDTDGDAFPNFYGTSAAAPAAAAAAALLLQANGTLTGEDIRVLLQQTALDMDDATTPGFDVGVDAQTGSGLVRIDRALQFVDTKTIRNDALTTLFGTSIGETVTGNDANNVIYANGGDDTVTGGLGADTLYGGDGNDTLYGNQAADTLRGGTGNDTLYGGQGNDLLYGDAGDDRFVGGLGDDRMYGGLGDDFFVSGAGEDLMEGGLGTNTVDYGVTGSRLTVNLAAGIATSVDGTDTLVSIRNVIGTAFADSIAGSEENDVLLGGQGTDSISGDTGDDIIDGGAGGEAVVADTVSRADVIKPQSLANIDLGTALRLNTAAGGDFDTNYDPDVTGSLLLPHATVQATASGDGSEYYKLSVKAGDRAIFDIDHNQAPDRTPLPTAMYLLDGAGNAIAASSGVSIDPGSEVGASYIDYTFSQGGDYYILIQQTTSSVIDLGSTYTLNVSLSSAVVETTGASTAIPDALAGGIGVDTLLYASATAGVTVDLSKGDGRTIQRTGGGGDDIINGFENLTGSSFDDTLLGDFGDNVLTGAAGNDVVIGAAGNDTLYGNEGSDIMYGNQGRDTLYGGKGADTLYGGKEADFLFGNLGDDILQGGIGADTLTGGAGADVFRYVIAADSTVAEADTITDFEAGVDKFDLTAVRTSLNDLFTISRTLGGSLLSIDLGGDGTVDMQIGLAGTASFSMSDMDWGPTAKANAAAIDLSSPMSDRSDTAFTGYSGPTLSARLALA